MLTNITRKICAIGCVTLMLGGCNSTPVRHNDYTAARPAPAPIPPAGNGAIYQAGYEMILFEDRRARRVGDIITIVLNEKMKGKKASKADNSRDNTTSITNPLSGIFGASPRFSLPGIFGKVLDTARWATGGEYPAGATYAETTRPYGAGPTNSSAGTRGLNLGMNLRSSNSFEGEGSADLSNELTGDITVTIIEVLPNNNMVVRGEKRIGINDGNEYIRIVGIIRPDDITPDNKIISTRVADATIQYVADGNIANASKPGWLSSFASGPLMPF